MKILISKDFHLGLGLFLAFIFISLVLSYPLYIKPNVFLVFLLSLGFFIPDFFVFSLFSLLGLLFFKYVPFFQFEYLALVVCAPVIFLVFRFFLSRSNIFILMPILLVLQTLLWVIFSDFREIFSSVFVLEYIYNCIILSGFFIFGLWLKKIFY